MIPFILYVLVIVVRKCPVCSQLVPSLEYDRHFSSCSNKQTIHFNGNLFLPSLSLSLPVSFSLSAYAISAAAVMMSQDYNSIFGNSKNRVYLLACYSPLWYYMCRYNYVLLWFNSPTCSSLSEDTLLVDAGECSICLDDMIAGKSQLLSF